MVKRFALALLLFFISGIALAQFVAPEKTARKSIAKKKWRNARESLNKALSKTAINPGVEYVWAEFFFNNANPEFHVDSAYDHTIRAQSQYRLVSSKEKTRLRRIDVDSASIIWLRQLIETAAFERAGRINTEAAFLHFLDQYTFAEQRDQAVALRDEAAYSDAVKANTHHAFNLFLEKYPGSVRAGEALKSYHELLFKEKTADKTLLSYETFLKEYPDTPYRSHVQKQIFMIFTGSGRPEKYFDFLRIYPSSPEAQTARNILFHQFGQESAVIERIMTDSLRNVRTLNKDVLLPILKDNKFGFINSSGKMIIAPLMDSIPQDYKCGNIVEDVLLAGNQLIGRNGAKILEGNINALDDLGEGFLLVEADECLRVIHKSGFVVTGCVDDAKLLSQNFIAAKKNGRWAIISFSSLLLTDHVWDDLSGIKNVILLKRNNKIFLTTVDRIAQIADQVPLNLGQGYDEVKQWTNELIWLRAGDDEEVVDQHLNQVIKGEKQILTQTSFGIIGKSGDGARLYSKDGHLLSRYKDITVSNPWVVAATDSLWRFVDPTTGNATERLYDSIRFTGPFPHAFRADSLDIFFKLSQAISFPRSTRSVFIPAKDSTALLVIQADKRKSVYNGRGKLLFSADYEDIQYAGEGFFIVSRKEKKGLAGADGKLVLPIEYDAIGTVSHGVVSLLKAMKFGAYNIRLKKLIKAQYEKNLGIYTANLISAYQKGYYGFIDWQNKPLSPANFDEITYWTDSVALVRTKSTWQLFNIRSNQVVEDGLHNIDYLYDTREEKLAIVKQDNTFGVLSSVNGFIIPPTFTFLTNVGSVEQPVYFTEKHVEEASIFVVIYYDANGQMLFRQVYEEDAYQKIVCQEN